MRMEGMDNDVKGLKYVILVYLLLNQATTSINIDVEAHKKLFNECYNKHFELKLHDIRYLYDELTCRYLIRREQKICFQHLALQESVLISYCKINTKAIIPLLSIDHLVDLVRLQNHVEQEDEIVIKILKPYYPELAAKIISIMNCERYEKCELDKFVESKIFTDSDLDLICELIGCISNIIDSSSLLSALSLESYTRHYFPLYLLRNIEKGYDKWLTVIHTTDQMLISLTIRDKHISLGVNPDISLVYALESKCRDIIEWLLKNIDLSLLDFTNCFSHVMPNTILEYIKLILQNVKHDKIDMTQFFINVCINCNNQYELLIDWMVDNVDTSLICFDICIDQMLKMSSKIFIDLILYILKKVKLLDINKVVNKSIRYGPSDVILKVLQQVNPELFEKEEIVITMIPDMDDDEYCWAEIIELILPWMKYSDFNRFVEKADDYGWYSVLELLIKHVSDLSINIVQLIEKIFKRWDDDDDDDDEEEDEEREIEYEHIEHVFRLLLKHHIDSIGVAEIIIEKACDVGSHRVVEELLMDKIDNISYYLNRTLNKCLSRRCDELSVSNDGGYGKLLMLFLQRVNTKFIDLRSLMNDVCNIGHSSAVLWLLRNYYSLCFDMKNVMNKASYHGDLELVEYLQQKYKAGDFDYKTAMIKACRNSQENTLDVCKWLWANIDCSVFDMKAALTNASRCDNNEVVEWILDDVDMGLYDIEAAVYTACENGEDDTVKLLLNKSSINMIDFEHAITLACKNENSGLQITKLLYERADKSKIDINTVLADACKCFRSDIFEWIIQTCDQNITVTETKDAKQKFIKSLDKNLVDMDQAVTCILGMDTPEQKKDQANEIKIQLLMLILNKSDQNTIHVYKLLTEACKNDWVEIFQRILGRVDNACLNIGEIINVACQNGSFHITKWSLEKIDMQLVDADNVLVQSSGFGWLECLVLIWKHCNKYKLQTAMTEACTYGHLHIAKWLLQKVHYKLFNIPMLLQESGRNGWINIFRSLLQNVKFDKSDIHNATSQALENGQLKIADLALSKVGKAGFDFSSLSEKAYTSANKEGVVKFVLFNCDPSIIDIATIMTNACLFGWKDIATFIIDKNLTSVCKLSLAFNTACENGELEIAQLLLDKVEPYILTSVDKAMCSVAVKGWDEIAVLLLEKVEHSRLDIGNALIEACRHGEIDVVQAILQKVDNAMLDVETALNKACESHMHEKLVLLMLENIDQVDLKTVKKQAVRHKWWKVQFALTKVDIKDLNQVVQETETDNIIILE